MQMGSWQVDLGRAGEEDGADAEFIAQWGDPLPLPEIGSLASMEFQLPTTRDPFQSVLHLCNLFPFHYLSAKSPTSRSHRLAFLSNLGLDSILPVLPVIVDSNRSQLGLLGRSVLGVCLGTCLALASTLLSLDDLWWRRSGGILDVLPHLFDLLLDSSRSTPCT